MDSGKTDARLIRACQITATRNRLIHGYFDVDLNVVWKIVTEDVPVLAQSLQALI